MTYPLFVSLKPLTLVNGDSLETIKEELNNQSFSDSNNMLIESININFNKGLVIILVALLCGYIVRKLYLNYTLTYSSPKGFGNTLLMVLLSVSGLIAVVKSSLALSLGLVGALSVIRFRTAVKEPFTLSFILWLIHKDYKLKFNGTI